MRRSSIHKQESYYSFFPTEYFSDLFPKEKDELQIMEKGARTLDKSKRLREEYIKALSNRKDLDWFKSEVDIAKEVLSKAKENTFLSIEARIKESEELSTFFSLLIAILGMGTEFFHASEASGNSNAKVVVFYVGIGIIFKGLTSYLLTHSLHEGQLKMDETFSRSNICFCMFESAIDYIKNHPKNEKKK